MAALTMHTFLYCLWYLYGSLGHESYGNHRAQHSTHAHTLTLYMRFEYDVDSSDVACRASICMYGLGGFLMFEFG